ncbi:unnamed protein product [Cyclocybe aegerita]|uniref:NAD-dependent epimerase/dehydratase domain-containing protein n=1 Tax=Cyclocybe aegerita TaxID=1973307 RepID=A0A8S0VT88_CYCAE|nr:unnamed protein product [Cyclocybe aegerita]
MTILITGGTGQTGAKLAQLLHDANVPFLIATRKGVAPEPFKAVQFDWTDASTFENPFRLANVDKIYLIAPLIMDVLPVMKPFIELAIVKGAKRFVLLCGTGIGKGDPFVGKVYEYLAQRGVDYDVLRPTWFMENFGTFFYKSIREDNEVITVVKDGRIPFVAADDIAKVAFDVLTAEQSSNDERFVIGPELFSYDQAAALLSEVLGRKITHKRVTNEEERAIFQANGLKEDYAVLLNTIEARLADDVDAALVGNSKSITGKIKLRDFFEANKQLWIKA